MKFLKRAAIALAGLVVLYYLAFGVLHLAGFRIYKIPTFGMHPTIAKGETVVGRLSDSYRDRISRFEIVVYVVRIQGTEEIYAKRVIGLSGEHIVINAQGISINEQPLALPAEINVEGLKVKPCDLTIPTDAVFMLGDNTANSADSRYLGPTLKKDVVGYLLFKK